MMLVSTILLSKEKMKSTLRASTALSVESSWNGGWGQPLQLGRSGRSIKHPHLFHNYVVSLFIICLSESLRAGERKRDHQDFRQPYTRNHKEQLEMKLLLNHSDVFPGCLEDFVMYPHEPVCFDGINTKHTEELERLPELSNTSLSNVSPFHIHASEDLVQSWKSQTWSPDSLDRYNTAYFTKPRAIDTRWGYVPRKGTGFVFICQCSCLTPFPPADTQTGLSRTARTADERKVVCVEIMKLINKPAQWLLRHKRTLLVTFTEGAPLHRPYKAAVIILIKRFLAEDR